MKASVIICAAGKGSRAGFEKNKLLYPFPGDKKTVLEKTVQAFVRNDIGEIIVTAAPADEKEIQTIIERYPRCKIVRGGETRTQSVKNALHAVTGEIVLIHDGARPYVSDKIISDCMESIKKYGSGVCALPLTDTVAMTKDNEITSVPSRENVFALQTPQGFFTSDMVRAYSQITMKDSFTDDSAVYAKFIGNPHIFIGEKENKKMTFREDFSQRIPRMRTGIGIDTHAFGKKQDYIVLGGVKIPSETGLIAHSDGDVVLHAIMDALLSAAGLPDIGHFFPDTNDDWKDSDSTTMLGIVTAKVQEQGFSPCNVSVAIQAQKPRLAEFVPTMSENIAKIINLPKNAVGVSAGTNEGLGYIGEGKGITVTATVLLYES